MSRIFHLAIPVMDIEESKEFYCNFLGCDSGNSEEGKWIDINFWGNELTLHQAGHHLESIRHDVDMGAVCVPHFGAHLEENDFQNLKQKILKSEKYNYLDDPYRRFKGDYREQETFFIKDPSGNILEIKTMMNPESLFED